MTPCQQRHPDNNTSRTPRYPPSPPQTALLPPTSHLAPGPPPALAAPGALAPPRPAIATSVAVGGEEGERALEQQVAKPGEGACVCVCV
jgi:hypothetical protein